LKSSDRYAYRDPRWLVNGWLGRDHLSLLVGDGSAGKSTLACDLAIALAAGQPFLGIPTRRSRVLYLDEDGSAPDLMNRIAAFRAGRNVASIPLDDYLLIHPASGLTLETDVGAISDTGKGCDLIIFDALIAFHGKDENDAASMRLVMRTYLRPIIRATGAAVLVLHHTAKPGRDTDGNVISHIAPRGSSEIKNACDAILEYKSGENCKDLSLTRCRFARRVLWGSPLSIALDETEASASLVHTYATKQGAAEAYLMACDPFPAGPRPALELLTAAGHEISLGTADRAYQKVRSLRSDCPTAF
jgi:hypothetical protein